MAYNTKGFHPSQDCECVHRTRLIALDDPVFWPTSYISDT